MSQECFPFKVYFFISTLFFFFSLDLLFFPRWEDKGTPTLSRLWSVKTEVTARLVWSALSLKKKNKEKKLLAPAVKQTYEHFG